LLSLAGTADDDGREERCDAHDTDRLSPHRWATPDHRLDRRRAEEPGLVRKSGEEPLTVELGGKTWDGRAVVLSGAERDLLFAAVVKAAPTFGRYQERTERTIPVVELLPVK
jgi:F420H(2)-dependent quinone reductase